jgi:predicted nuclease of predicted toxin-antitoxin system
VRIELDETLPAGLVPLLAALGHEVDTVPGEDDVVWRAAQTDGRFLGTQDLDFSDTRKYAPVPHGLLLVRLPQPGRLALQECVASRFGPNGRNIGRLRRDRDDPEGAGQQARVSARTHDRPGATMPPSVRHDD